MSEQNKVSLFNEGGGVALAAQSDAAAVARATQEIQAALTIAQRFPRDEVRIKSRILEACKRKELAEEAEYEYSRGGTRITGPTVDLLRAIANRWGNIRYGWTEVERRDGQSLVRCFAWDMQSNGQAERTFSIKHWRDTQAGGYELKDERDIYELLANMAARRVRACLEEVIDSDIVTAAIDQCRETLKTGEKTPLADRAVQMVGAFKEIGVTQEMIEARLQNNLASVSENQLATLRRIFKALKDGVGKREDYFKPETSKPNFDKAPEKSPAEKAEAAAGLAPDPNTAATEAPKANGFNPVKALRNLAKMAKVTEGEVLDFLSETGSTDGSVSTFEELALYQDGAVIKSACDNSPGIAEQLKAAKGGDK
jgi:hypothetical protein